MGTNISFLHQLLEYSLKDYILSDKKNERKYRSALLIRNIRQTNNGTRRALKKAINSCMVFWIQYGYYIIIKDFALPTVSPETKTNCSGSKNKMSSEVVQFIRSKVDEILSTFGKIISYLVWLFSKKNNLPLDECKYLIRDIVERCIQEQKNCIEERGEETGTNRTVRSFFDRDILPFLIASSSLNDKRKMSERQIESMQQRYYSKMK